MSKLSKGPQVKMPSVRAPKFATDLYSDLRDRRLLPLIAVLAVAIIAVPIALKKSSPTLSTTAGLSGLPAPGTATDTSAQTVVAYAPGLRDYKRRLNHLKATDPFKQHFTGAKVTGGGTTGAGTTTPPQITTTDTGSTASGAPYQPAPPNNTDTGGTGSGPGPTTVKVETKYASYEIDVKIVKTRSMGRTSGSSSRRTPPTTVIRHHLPELTMLPSAQRPASVYMGVNADASRALLLVSSDVKAVFGDAQCVIGSQVCQMLAMEPGLPETFVYGDQGRRYSIEILKITKVVSSNPRRAQLGK